VAVAVQFEAGARLVGEGGDEGGEGDGDVFGDLA